MSHNGSADLRSPEKEVYFRSWDLANSQMCEVRVATSNICGCNPPNRCGKRSGADFATSVSCMSSSGLEALSCPFSTKFIKCTELRFTTSPAIAYTQCCAFALYFQSVWSIFKGRIFSVGKAHSLASFCLVLK